jgi:hypothetical protein
LIDDKIAKTEEFKAARKKLLANNKKYTTILNKMALRFKTKAALIDQQVGSIVYDVRYYGNECEWVKKWPEVFSS